MQTFTLNHEGKMVPAEGRTGSWLFRADVERRLTAALLYGEVPAVQPESKAKLYAVMKERDLLTEQVEQLQLALADRTTEANLLRERAHAIDDLLRWWSKPAERPVRIDPKIL